MKNITKRKHWIQAVENAWSHRSVIWLSGVRRTGKTSLSHTLSDIEYFDCELPRTRRLMEDPEEFLAPLNGKRVVLDEVHRLSNPAQLLKIAADHFPEVKILATGSSTLGASRKFKDTLTGRKTSIWLTPLTLTDIDDFNKPDMRHRLLCGGLPPFFLANKLPESDFQEWMDSYWAKDIQELFRLERRDSFQRFFELIIIRSGGIFEASAFTSECEVSRQTITNYLRVLDSTFVAHIIKPFSTRRSTEIISAPKIYGFDTGFVCYHRGWNKLRDDDLGILWEHFVLNELQARLQTRDIRYWRDKRGHEVDYVIARGSQPPIAIECKWAERQFDLKNLKAFRKAYPKGDNYLVCHDVERPFTKKVKEIQVSVVSLKDLIQRLNYP
jgi:uncharacterized protein